MVSLDLSTDEEEEETSVVLLGKGVEISLKKALWRAMHANRTVYGKKISDLKSFFRAIDADGGGTIKRHELHAALLRLDVGAQPRQMDRLLRTIDDDGGGDIDFEEFEAWMLRRKPRALAEPEHEPEPELEPEPEPEPESRQDELLKLAIELGRAVGAVDGAATGLALQRPPADVTGTWRAWGEARPDNTLQLSLRTQADVEADDDIPLFKRQPARSFNELFVLQQDADGAIAGKEVPGEPQCSFLGHWEGSKIRLKQWYPHLPADCATDWLITPQLSGAAPVAEGLLTVDRFVGQWSGGCQGTFEAERDDTTVKAAQAAAAATAAGRQLLHTVRRAIRTSDETTVLRWLQRATFVQSLSAGDETKDGAVSIKALRDAASAHAACSSLPGPDVSLPQLLEDGLSLVARPEEDVVQLTAVAQLIVGWHWLTSDDNAHGETGAAAIPMHWPVACSVGDELDGCSFVWLAAEAGNETILRALLKAGGAPDTANDKKTTPVHIAAQNCTPSAIKLLLSTTAANSGGAAARSLADAKNGQGLTALGLVCSSPRSCSYTMAGDIIVALVEGGADPEHSGMDGRRSPLWLAAAHGHVGAVRALLNCHRCHDSTAKGTGQGQVAEDGSRRAAVNRRICADGCGLSPLLIACQRGHAAVVEVLLDADADHVDAAAGMSAMPSGPGPCIHLNCGKPRQYGDPEHETPWRQEERGQTEAPRLLPAGEPWFCEAHARASDVSLCAWTPYYVACASGQQAVVELLRKRGLGDTADGGQPQSYTKGADLWHQPKMLPRALPEALLPKSRPAIGDLVLLPSTHQYAPSGIGKVVGHYDKHGACAIDAPDKDHKITRQTITPENADLGGTFAEAPPNYTSRPFPAGQYMGIGRYYSAKNSLQRRYVMGVGTIAEGQGSKGLTHEYTTIRADPQRCWAHLKGYKGKDVSSGAMPKGPISDIRAGGPDDYGVGTPVPAWQKAAYVETVRQYPPPKNGARFTPYVPAK